MDIFKLTPKEGVILAAAQLQANATAKALSDETGIAEHLVRYSLNKFEQAGLLNRRAMLNPSRIGLVPYALFFSVTYETSSAEKLLAEILVSSALTAGVFEVGGDFQFGMLLYAEEPFEVFDFVGRLADVKGVTLIEKSIGIRMSTTLLRRRYLGARPSAVEKITIERGPAVYAVDELDHRILKGLTQTKHESRRDLARLLNLPHTTLDTRVRKLEEAGVIAGYVYGMDIQKLGLSTSRILFSTKGSPQRIWEKVSEFGAREHNVLQLARSLGSWDYELLVETPTGREVVEITRRLHDALGNAVLGVKTLPVYRYLKVNEYPLV